jgi:biotin carboxyl carrier protein
MWIDAAAERKVKKPRNTQTLCFFQWFKAGVAENLYSQCLVSGTDYNNNNDNNNDNDNDNDKHDKRRQKTRQRKRQQQPQQQQQQQQQHQQQPTTTSSSSNNNQKNKKHYLHGSQATAQHHQVERPLYD